MELETDKAVVEVPSSVTGTVKEIKVKEGEKVKVGQVIFTLEGGASAPEKAKHAPVEHISEQHEARLSLQAAIQAEGKTAAQVFLPDQPQPHAPKAFSMPEQLGKVAGTEHRAPAPAAPHVRRLAREIGVDIYEVKGSGPGRTHQRRRCEGIRQIVADFGRSGRIGAGTTVRATGAARLHQVWKSRTRLHARGAAQDGAASVGGLDHDSARDPAGQGRHHGARTIARPLRAQSAGSRRQDDGDCDRVESLRLRAESFPPVQCQHRHVEGRDHLQAVHQYRRGRGHRPRLAGPGAARCGQEKHCRTGCRTDPAVEESPRQEARALQRWRAGLSRLQIWAGLAAPDFRPS